MRDMNYTIYIARRASGDAAGTRTEGGGGGIWRRSEASRKIINSGLFKGSIELVDFGSITSMYGGLHCSTQVRAPRAPRKGLLGFN